MARHSHSRRSSEDREYVSISHSRTISRSNAEENRLPSLSEVIPEISWTHPPSANIADYRRELHHNPQGPAHYHPTPTLVSPPATTSRSGTRPTLDVHEATPTGSTRRLPIHSGPIKRNSGSSSSSDLSSNRKTSNTSPSVSPVHPPHDSGSRQKVLERPRPVEAETAPTSRLSPGMPSPYGPCPSHTQQPARYCAYGYEQPQPYQPGGLKYPPPMPATTSASGYPGYSMPPNVPGYLGAHGQPLYIDNFQPPEGERRTKKRRGNLPKWQTDFMRAWYNNHFKNPYPTEEEKHMIMQETGLTIEQVANWFINCRRRHGPEITRQAQAESNLRRAHSGTSHGSTHESPTRRREPLPK
ncbi:MAG: hypothetical protein HETSPECPRED_006851 [Heterodermia speciosa]|uniref:Homeobox domain-containing protein n=1 Tax=Heterodermia speciosa TaxID=116794 RepID=A0A8H3FSE0_9LECA|nr:MAG: hypothetical protein HETSPECPRED_006851 [Heterodermia speciosa]